MQSITTIRSLKEKQRQEREELILQAAEEMLAEKGYHETSMDEIAVRVGIAKGTVYLHFPSKEDLVMAIFERGMLKLLEGVEASIASETTTRAKMEAVLRFIYGGFFNKRSEALFSMFGSNSGELRRLFADPSSSERGRARERSAAGVRSGAGVGTPLCDEKAMRACVPPRGCGAVHEIRKLTPQFLRAAGASALAGGLPSGR